MRTPLLFLTLIFSALLFVIDQIALKYNLYFSTPWADIVTHILGGAIIAGLAIYFSNRKTSTNLYSKRIWPILGCSLFVGIFWEILEASTGMTSTGDKGYAIDTASDLFFDIFGSYLMYIFVKSIYGKR
ncbi:MAG TPA: hypothetical protein VJH63_00400 [Candidatus Paceibacterota bacterium]